MKKLWIILILPLLLVACEGGKDKKSDESKADKKAEETLDKEEKGDEKGEKKDKDAEEKDESESKVDSKKAEKAKKKDKKDVEEKTETNGILSEEKKEEYHQKALDYVNKMGEYYIVYDEYGDFNADFYDDGKIEGIVFIQDAESITDVLLLDVEGSEAKLLSTYNILNLNDEFFFNDAIFDTAGFINLNGFENPVPFVERSERSDATSYIFFYVAGDYIEPFLDTTNSCDVGTTELIDNDNDGYYDEYVLERWGYDVFYYPLTLNYKFADEMDYFDSGQIEVGEYPFTPIDVVKEYLYLSQIKNYQRNDVGEFNYVANLDERLAELSTVSFDESYIYSQELLEDTVLQIDTRADFEEEIYDNLGTVTVYPSPYYLDLGERELVFEVLLENGRWIITGIYFLDDYWDIDAQ